jgi:hypothetical protein
MAIGKYTDSIPIELFNFFFKILSKKSIFIILIIIFNKLSLRNSLNISLFQLDVNFFISFKRSLLTNDEREKVKSKVK